jgi:PEP-CTERM motif
MKAYAGRLIILFLALACVPAWAQHYDNGPINGTTDAWTINYGYVVSDSFVAPAYGVGYFNIGVWEFPLQPGPCALYTCGTTGGHILSLQWSITSGENSGTVYGSGTASGANLTDTFMFTNQFGYNIDLITVYHLGVFLTEFNTYWLNLSNAVVPGDTPVYWDENSGKGCESLGCPSKASESTIGTIPSEAFTIGCEGCGCVSDRSSCDLEPGSTPEPNSILLFGSGVLCLGGVLRRKLISWKY